VDIGLIDAPVVISLGRSLSPREALARFADLPNPSLLESGAPGHPLSRHSYLAADPVATIAAGAAEWPAVRDRVRRTFRDAAAAESPAPFSGGWIGWFAYELGTAFDRIERHPEPAPMLPDVALALYDWVIAWDHGSGEATLISTGVDGDGVADADRARQRTAEVLERWHSHPSPDARVDELRTAAPAPNFTPEAYQAAVEQVVEYILAGDIFQANLAQRFRAPFRGSAAALYSAVMDRTAAPMAAFLQRGDAAVISASPERFLRLEQPARRVETRPIKGTRPRDADPMRDAALAGELAASAKDRAENVMIVDLMRNDLSRVCRPGSVATPTLCALESHPTVHHLVSIVTGELRATHDALDLIAATFPGGSITGAPKLRAMEIIRELEPVARGVYSGAIGWIGLDGGMDTSIAIRTITLSGDVATFHAGGGITALSDAATEYRETLDKGRALSAALADGP
jgi:para-aminobenzoate synthetase component 1